MKDIRKTLSEYDKNEVDIFISYVEKLKTDKKRDGKLVNFWATKRSDSYFIDCFKRCCKEGLYIDGKHVTIGTTGLSYDYIAYKNKMLIAYPETELFFSEVYEGDLFDFSNDNGKIIYSHKFNNPFEKSISKIIGLYCIVKNKRGEFITFMNMEEIKKHRAVARTQKIWNDWALEMMYKTIIKKACRVHFSDVFESINEEDNKTIDLSKSSSVNENKDIEIDIRLAVEKIETYDGIVNYYKENKAKYPKDSFDKITMARAEEIKKGEIENENS